MLGTAGGVARARDRGLLGENDAVLVWNGDMLSELSAVALASAHDRAHRESHAFATLAIRRRPAGEGSVGLTVEGRVVRLRKTSSGPEEHGGDFLGISVLSNACLNALPRLGCLVGDAWIPAMLRGDYIHGWYTDAHTADVGNIQDYAKENFRWLASQVTPTTGLFRGSYIGVGATVDRATNSIVGAGARVRGSVNNSIVWPTMEVDGPLDGVIVGPGFRVPIPQG